MSDENVAVSEESSTATVSVPDAVNVAINETFKGVDSDGVRDQPPEAKASPTAQQRADKEQREELIEEGLLNEDGSEPDPDAPPVPEEEKVEAAVEEAAPEPPTVDPTLRAIANELGWPDDKINELYVANPELAESTFSKLAETYANLSRQFLPQQGSQAAPGTPAPVETPAQPDSPTSRLDALYNDLSAFAEGNGEEIVDKFLKPLKEEIINPLRELLAETQVRKQEIARTEARQTVVQLSSKFGDVYGQDTKPLTTQQTEARSTLGYLADQLRAGAKMQGRELSIPDAINRAHLIVTAERRDQAVRNQIKTQVQKRANGLSAKPTQRHDPKLVDSKSKGKAGEVVNRFWADKGVDADLD